MPVSAVFLVSEWSPRPKQLPVMAAFFRWFRCALLFSHSLISLLQHVSGTHEGFLSVQHPYVYVVTGKELSLYCTLNGSSLSTSRVSWKRNGKWLHNQTKRSATKVQLVLRNVTPQQHGLYQCSVFDLSAQSPSEVIPKDVNVTVVVGDPISKPICISNRPFRPKVMLIWNILHVDGYPSVPQFTYNVLYCHKPTFQNRLCLINFNMYRQCSDLSVNSSASNAVQLKCNVTFLFMKLFPNLYDVTEQVSGKPTIFFRLTLGNVHIQGGYSRTDIGHCNPIATGKCTRPDNIHLISSKRKTLSLIWDAPNDLGYRQNYLHYLLLFAVDGVDKNQTVDIVTRDLHNISYDFTSLHPYTMHHIFIACSITSEYGSVARGEYVGPFSARTVEQEPSDHPRIFENFTATVLHEEYRNVTFIWRLPDKATWNGIITRFVLHYWTVNSSMAENGARGVEVFSNVSNTTGTVTNLLLNETYAVTVQMCTRVGCGPTSEVIYVWAEMTAKARRIQKPPKEGGVDSLLIIGVISGLAVLIIVASIMTYLWAKKLRKHRSLVKKKPLSEVVGDLAPNLYDSPNEPSKIEDSGVYDETIVPFLSGETDYVQIRSSQTDLPTQRTSDHDSADDKDSGSTEV